MVKKQRAVLMSIGLYFCGKDKVEMSLGNEIDGSSSIVLVKFRLVCSTNFYCMIQNVKIKL